MLNESLIYEHCLTMPGLHLHRFTLSALTGVSILPCSTADRTLSMTKTSMAFWVTLASCRVVYLSERRT